MRRPGGVPGFILLAAALGQADWTRIDVPAGNFYSFAMSGRTLFAGTVRGLFRSDDNGDTWTHVENLGLDNTVYSVAVTGSSLYVAVIAWKVLRSKDNGASWSDAGTGLPPAVFPILAVGGGSLYDATDGSGIFRSPPP